MQKGTDACVFGLGNMARRVSRWLRTAGAAYVSTVDSGIPPLVFDRT